MIAAIISIAAFLIYYFIAKNFPDLYRSYQIEGSYYLAMCLTAIMFSFYLFFNFKISNKNHVFIKGIYLLCFIFSSINFIVSIIDYIVDDILDMNNFYFTASISSGFSFLWIIYKKLLVTEKISWCLGIFLSVLFIITFNFTLLFVTSMITKIPLKYYLTTEILKHNNRVKNGKLYKYN